jgi:hypothetical protein
MSAPGLQFARAGLRLLHLLAIVAMLVSPFSALMVVQPVSALAGSYNLTWRAADPEPNNAPFLPTYTKQPPSALACPTPSGGTGRAADPMANAVYGNPPDAVAALNPSDMALGQIVPFEVRIAVSGSTTPENGVIRFTGGWLTKTSNGGNFGFDPAYGIYCAFVDTTDAATNDPGLMPRSTASPQRRSTQAQAMRRSKARWSSPA